MPVVHTAWVGFCSLLCVSLRELHRSMTPLSSIIQCDQQACIINTRMHSRTHMHVDNVVCGIKEIYIQKHNTTRRSLHTHTHTHTHTHRHTLLMNANTSTVLDVPDTMLPLAVGTLSNGLSLSLGLSTNTLACGQSERKRVRERS